MTPFGAFEVYVLPTKVRPRRE